MSSAGVNSRKATPYHCTLVWYGYWGLLKTIKRTAPPILNHEVSALCSSPSYDPSPAYGGGAKDYLSEPLQHMPGLARIAAIRRSGI